jgi:hypothetical protein
MNSLVLDVPTMATEPQLKRYCTIFILDGTIKIDSNLFAQYISNSLSVSSVIAQNLQYSPYTINYNCANPILCN